MACRVSCSLERLNVCVSAFSEKLCWGEVAQCSRHMSWLSSTLSSTCFCHIYLWSIWRNGSGDMGQDSSLHPTLHPTVSLTQLLPIKTTRAQGREWSLERMNSVFYIGGSTLTTGILLLLYLLPILGNSC